MPATTPATQVPGLGVIRAAEAQRVQIGDRPRAHGEDVAQDAADPGRRALIGLDEGRVVVALHLEDRRLAVADVDDAGVLARPADHARPWSAASSDGAATTCRSNARSTSPRRCRARCRFGRGPSRSRQRSYSSGVSPCWATTSSEILGFFGHDERSGQSRRTMPSVGAAEQRVGHALRMRHQAEHASWLVEHAGDVAQRAVGIGCGRDVAVGVAVAEGDVALAFERVERRVVGM